MSRQYPARSRTGLSRQQVLTSSTVGLVVPTIDHRRSMADCLMARRLTRARDLHRDGHATHPLARSPDK